jgi:hypothetical protein
MNNLTEEQRANATKEMQSHLQSLLKVENKLNKPMSEGTIFTAMGLMVLVCSYVLFHF